MDDDSTTDLVGGHPILDLVNTVSWRLDPGRRQDRVDTPDRFAAWARRAGVAPPDGALDPVTDADLRRVRRLREDAHDVLVASMTDGPAPAAARRRLQSAMAAAVAGGLTTEHPPYRFAGPVETAEQIPLALAASAVDLLVLTDLTHLRRCEGDGCGWLYLDRSRSHTRRWCSSQDCGNRDRVQRFTRRRQQAAPGPR